MPRIDEVNPDEVDDYTRRVFEAQRKKWSAPPEAVTEARPGHRRRAGQATHIRPPARGGPTIHGRLVPPVEPSWRVGPPP